MPRLRASVALSFLLLGCGSSGDPGGGEDAGPDGGDALMVFFAEPMGSAVAAYQPVPIRVVTSQRVDSVGVLLDGVLTANLGEPPYEWSLPTESLAPGAHTLVPRATLGAAVVDGPAVTLTIDRTPPGPIDATDIDTSRDGALWPERTFVRVAFDEPLHALSATTLSITATHVGNEGDVVLPGTLHVEGNVVVMTPHEAWPPEQQITITVNGKVRDLSGNEVTVSASDLFTVRTYWQHFALTEGGLHVFDADVNERGDAFFLHVDLGTPDRLVGTGEVGGEVVSFTRTIPSGSLITAAGALAGDGAIFVTWVVSASSGSGIYVMSRAPGDDDFTAPIQVHPSIAMYMRLFVAASGHAFLRVKTAASTYVTYVHEPGVAGFEATTTYDDVPFWDAPPVLPGTTGRACGLHAETSGAPSTVTHTMRCRGGGTRENDVALGGPRALPLGFADDLSTNDVGDAAVVIDRDVYVFDGDLETATLATTLPSVDDRIARIGDGGDLCIVYGTHDRPFDGIYASNVQRRRASGLLVAAEVAHEYPYAEFASFNGSNRAAVDAAGHCFVTVGNLSGGGNFLN